MLQVIFIVIGTVYFFRLLGLDGKASKLGLNDPSQLERWKAMRRKQYLWMIAAGWGIAALMIGASAAIGATVRLTLDGALELQLGMAIGGTIAMIACAVMSGRASSQASAIESARGGETNVTPAV